MPLPYKQTKRWREIERHLSRTCRDAGSFEQLVQRCLPDHRRHKRLYALRHVLGSGSPETFRRLIFEKAIPFMQRITLDMPRIFRTNEISLLPQRGNGQKVLNEREIACLLAACCFGLFTWKRAGQYPNFDITVLYEHRDHMEQIASEKLKCIFQYFITMSDRSTSMDFGKRKVKFVRRVVPKSELEQFRTTSLESNTIPLCPFEFHRTGSIEDETGCLEIDFANKFIGGGVLGFGCVQEEIRFLINTECIVSLLFCEEMKVNEAICIFGSEQFSTYRGYGVSGANPFEYTGRYYDGSPMNGDGFRKVAIVAIDAEKFPRRGAIEQFELHKLKRELIKAYAGFSMPSEVFRDDYKMDSRRDEEFDVVATGNWGCGVFGGNVELKLMLQWMAASLANRKMKYFGFRDQQTRHFPYFTDTVLRHRTRIGELFRFTRNFSDLHLGEDGHRYQSIIAYILEQLGERVPEDRDSSDEDSPRRPIERQSSFEKPREAVPRRRRTPPASSPPPQTRSPPPLRQSPRSYDRESPRESPFRRSSRSPHRPRDEYARDEYGQDEFVGGDLRYPSDAARHEKYSQDAQPMDLDDEDYEIFAKRSKRSPSFDDATLDRGNGWQKRGDDSIYDGHGHDVVPVD